MFASDMADLPFFEPPAAISASGGCGFGRSRPGRGAGTRINHRRSPPMQHTDSSRRRLRSAPAYERRYGYSRGIAEDPFIFISGTTALDPVTFTVAGDTAQQTQ